MKFFIVLFLNLVVAGKSDDWPCDRSLAIAEFAKKQLLNPFPTLTNDPYKNQTDSSLSLIKQTLANTSIVCGLKYNDATKKSYELNTFSSENQAKLAGYTITHQGKCGVCSTTVDLAVYLAKNLTVPVRKCAMKTVLSNKWALDCLKALGFSDNCANIWLDNSLNTRKHCFGVCMKSWLENEPFNLPDGSLNACLQCDEDQSGPVFQFFSGRTRRNSGIVSSIERPGDQVYHMNHCYY